MYTVARTGKPTQKAKSGSSARHRAAFSGQSREASSILHLQRTIGNQAVQRLLRAEAEGREPGSKTAVSTRLAPYSRDVALHAEAHGEIQPKLTINAPGDLYEQEADRIADRVMRMPEPQLQRACACGGGCAKCQTKPQAQEQGRIDTRRLQADATRETASPAVHDVLRSQGQALPPATRAFFETRFGQDFGQVRVHTDAKAAASARDVNARAYTVGRNVVFGAGQYAPSSNQGRRLLAHELTHVLQQGSGATTPRIQRTDWGVLGGTCCNRSPDGEEWALVGAGVWDRLPSGQCTDTTTDCNGMTCGGGFYYVDNLQTGTCRTPRHDDATFRPRRWTPGRPRSGAQSPTARGSTQGDTPTGYQYDREPYLIEHRSGSTYQVPGLYHSESEFGASGATSSLMAPAAERRQGRPVTGGFADDLDVDTAFGTGAERTAAPEVEALVRSARDRIDPRLLPAMQEVSTDRFVFRALRTFLETDNGRLVAWDNDGGRYDGDSLPPTINVGIAGGALDTRSTLVHELLHYVFDKADAVLGEARDTGGADHPAIAAIETRFLIIDRIRSGQPPLHEKIRSSFGQFLQGRDFFPAMEEAIAQNDPAALRAAVDDPAFVRTTVSSGLLPSASGLRFPAGPTTYHYTADQFRDLAFIWAQNAVIVRRAMRTAGDISTRTGTPLPEVFGHSAWQQEMATFLSRFVGELRRGRTRGVVSLESRL